MINSIITIAVEADGIAGGSVLRPLHEARQHPPDQHGCVNDEMSGFGRTPDVHSIS